MPDVSEIPLRIVLLAGEESGDILGSTLLESLRKRYPNAIFRGVAGPRMQAAGCRPMESIEALSLFGISEVVSQLPRLLKLRKELCQRILDWQPDVFIGIDAPSFNLGLEKRLKIAGIPTVHYVSPTVWAWRQGRVKGIKDSVDLMLTLFPFEADFYSNNDVDVTFVGHPLADQLPIEPDRDAACDLLSLSKSKRYVAVLPGSRRSEASRLSAPFIETMHWLSQRMPDVGFIVPLANNAVREIFESEMTRHDTDHLHIYCLHGQSHEAMTAADAVLLASGTAALEACLLKRPTVAAYRLSPFTYWLFADMGMVKVANVTLPNNLAAHPIVAEFIQDQATAECMGPQLYRWLSRPETTSPIIEECKKIHSRLRLNASELAADAIANLIDRKG